MKKTVILAAAAILILAASCGQNAQKQKTVEAVEEPQQEWVEEIWVEDIDAPAPAPPVPDLIVGTWKAKTKPYHAAYLEIFADGTAGRYLGSSSSNEIYEIYKGGVLPADGDSYPDEIGTGHEFDINLWFNLDWFIYESDGDTPVTGVPNSYKGTYTIRHYWEGTKQILHIKAKGDANPLFDKKELKMEWVPRTLDGSMMVEIEAVG